MANSSRDYAHSMTSIIQHQRHSETVCHLARVLEVSKEGKEEPLISDNYIPLAEVTAGSYAPHIRLIVCDLPTPENANTHLCPLFTTFNVPSQLVSEEAHAVGHSFGVRDSQGYHDTWFRYLQKNLHVIYHENGDTTVDSTNNNGEDYTWLKGGFYVRWHRERKTVDVIMATELDSPVVNKVFFEVTQFVTQGRPNNFDLIIRDPYQIYSLLWSQFFVIEDAIIWSVVALIRTSEHAVYDHAERQLEKGTDLSYHVNYDFVNLHNLAKHVNYLRETSETMLYSLKRIIESHEEFLSTNEGVSEYYGMPVRRNLRYWEDVMRGLDSRVGTMERRITSIVNLAFQLVTQLETRAAQKDSTSLKTVSYLTLVFLPGTAVATVFGSNFFTFDIDESGKQTFHVSDSFWIFWVWFVAVTAVTLIVWRVNHWFSMRELKERVSNPRRRFPRRDHLDFASSGFPFVHHPGGKS